MLGRKLIVTLAVVGWVAMPVSAGPRDHEGHDHAEHHHASIGEKAPDFELESSDGDTVKLEDFKGKVLVLEWTNHQCPFVKRHVAENKSMQKTFAQFKGKEVAWLQIDSSHFCADEVDSINDFREDNEVPFPTLLDPDGEVGHIYGAKTTPHMFVIGKDQTLVYMGAPDDDKMGTSESPRNYVAEAVAAAMTGSTVPVSKTESYGCSVKYKE